MDRRAAKELLHIRGWLERVAEVAAQGKDAYLGDDLLQEAGDSLMMKLGEAANRLSRLKVLEPDGVTWAQAVANRNFLIHQYDQINRELTWQTLSVALPKRQVSLRTLFSEADTVIDSESEEDGQQQQPNGIGGKFGVLTRTFFRGGTGASMMGA